MDVWTYDELVQVNPLSDFDGKNKEKIDIGIYHSNHQPHFKYSQAEEEKSHDSDVEEEKKPTKHRTRMASKGSVAFKDDVSVYKNDVPEKELSKTKYDIKKLEYTHY